jgi:hypothetical protein
MSIKAAILLSPLVNTTKRKFLAMIFFGLLLLGGGYFFVIQELWQKLQQQERQGVMLTSSIAIKRQRLSCSGGDTGRYANFTVQNAIFSSKLCQQFEPAALIDEIFLLARDSQLDIKVLTPGLAKEVMGFTAHSFMFTMTGAFKDFVLFSERLMHAQYFFVVNNFIARPAADNLIIEGELLVINQPHCVAEKTITAESYQKNTTFTNNIRDPFMTAEDSYASQEPDLTKMDVYGLKYIGSIQQNAGNIAIVEDAQGIVINLKIGDKIGTPPVNVTKITADEIFTSNASQNIYRRK